MIVNPVREALDYYKRLNEASKDISQHHRRRSMEPPSSPVQHSDTEKETLFVPSPDEAAQAALVSTDEATPPAISIANSGGSNRRAPLTPTGDKYVYTASTVLA